MRDTNTYNRTPVSQRPEWPARSVHDDIVWYEIKKELEAKRIAKQQEKDNG